MLEVEALIVATKKKVSHVITRHTRGLSQEQVQHALKDMEKLKTHPREEAVNRFLIKRAERAYQELSHEGRDTLSLLLDGFEAALNLQDATAIERHRTALEQFLDRHDAGPEDNPLEEDDWYRP